MQHPLVCIQSAPDLLTVMSIRSVIIGSDKTARLPVKSSAVTPLATADVIAEL